MTPLAFLRAALLSQGWRALLADVAAGAALFAAIWAGLVIAHGFGG